MEQAAITRSVGVAAGVFAPGYIGELTRIVPFEMVDDVLASTRAAQRRVRLVPTRVMVYLLLAGALFAELGYRQVFDRLCAGLAGQASSDPSGSALCQARQRLRAAPLKALFDLVRGPVATTATATRWRGLLVVAVDGTLLPVPDAPANLAMFAKQRCNNGNSGYPQIRLAALVACGTRAVIGAVFDPATTGELEYAGRLADDLRAGTLLLDDRNFAAAGLLNRLAATGAHLLVRCKSARRLPPVACCGDGSFLARLGALTVTTSPAIEFGTCWPGGSAGGDQQAESRARTSAVLCARRVSLLAARSEIRAAMACWVSGKVSRRPVKRLIGAHCRSSALVCSTQIRAEDCRRLASRQAYLSPSQAYSFGFFGGAVTWRGNSLARPW